MMARTPDWLVERLAAGDLPEEEARAIRRRLEAEPDGPERLAAIARENEEILAAYPPAVVAAAVRERALARRQKPNLVRLGIAAAVPACALLLLVALLPPTGGGGLPPDPEIRQKGSGPRLLVHRRTAEGAERLAAGSTARARDLLQLAYVAEGARFGVVLSIDGAGAVSLHLPIAGEEAASLEQEGMVALPRSWELDDAPGFERFFFVTADEPFAVAPVVEAARRLASGTDAQVADLRLPAELRQHSFLLVKVPR